MLRKMWEKLLKKIGEKLLEEVSQTKWFVVFKGNYQDGIPNSIRERMSREFLMQKVERLPLGEEVYAWALKVSLEEVNCLKRKAEESKLRYTVYFREPNSQFAVKDKPKIPVKGS